MSQDKKLIYDELVKSHDEMVLVLKAFQEMFKQVGPEMEDLKEMNKRLRAVIDRRDDEIRQLRAELYRQQPTLNSHPQAENEEEAY